MNTFGPSTLFLFSDKEYPMMLDKEVKDEIVNMYEKRIHEFLNTWMIFSCSNANCCKYKPKENNKDYEQITMEVKTNEN